MPHVNCTSVWASYCKTAFLGIFFKYFPLLKYSHTCSLKIRNEDWLIFFHIPLCRSIFWHSELNFSKARNRSWGFHSNPQLYTISLAVPGNMLLLFLKPIPRNLATSTRKELFPSSLNNILAHKSILYTKIYSPGIVIKKKL